MEGNTNHSEGCKCGCGGWHGKGGAFLIVRLIVAILLALVIFWGGFMLGELHVMTHSSFRGNSGYGMMGGWNTAQPMLRHNVSYGMTGGSAGTMVPPTTKSIPNQPATATQ